VTKDDIIRMAVESDLAYRCNHKWWMDAGEVGYELERFAALVASAEREACAELAEDHMAKWEGATYGVGDAIRQRGDI